MATQSVNIQTYVDKWVKVSTDGNVKVDFTHGLLDPSGILCRIFLRCKVCNQELSSDIPETLEKIDYALQKFVGLHRHKPEVNSMNTLAGMSYYTTATTLSSTPTIVYLDEDGNIISPDTLKKRGKNGGKKVKSKALKDEDGRRFRP